MGILLYHHVDKQNNVMELRLQIPVIISETRVLQEKISKLRFDVERFESPIHLLDLSQKPEFSHLKHPYLEDIVEVPQGDPLE